MDNTIRINPEKTYTKSEYSKEYNIHRNTIDKKIKDGEIQTVRVKGVTLIIAL